MSEVESINPNTPVTSNLTTEGKIETTATGGPLSFDELEEVTMAAKKAKSEKKEAKSETKQEKSQDLTSDTDKNKGKVPQPKEPKETAGKKASKDEESDAPTMTQARKMIKARFQDSEIDLDEEALVPVKVNGKEEMVPVRDLMGNYSGKVAWDKRFTEIDKMRKQATTDTEKVTQIRSALNEILSETDPEMKIMRIAEFAGMDPIQYRQQFYEQMYPMLEKQLIMSEDERRAADLAFEAKIHKQRADTYEQQFKRQEASAKLSGEIESLMANHKITPQELVSKYDQLDNLVKLGKIDPEQVNPQTIAVEIVKDRYTNSALKKINELGLSWDRETKFRKSYELMEQALRNGDTVEDMLAQMDEVAGSKKSRRLEEKKKARDEFIGGKKTVSQTRQFEEPSFFDDI